MSRPSWNGRETVVRELFSLGLESASPNSKRSQDRLGMEMMTFARCGFSGYGYALDPVRRDRGACSLGESQH
jgi:hypothetical protein